MKRRTAKQLFRLYLFIFWLWIALYGCLYNILPITCKFDCQVFRFLCHVAKVKNLNERCIY
jgi:hypothetical protein